MLTLVVVVGLAFYIGQHLDRYQRLLRLSYGSLLSLLALVVISVVINGLLNVTLYGGVAVPLTYSEGIGLGVVNSLANQLPLAGGLVAKGYYLKQRHSLPYTDFLGATGALYVCFVAANGVMGTVTLALLAIQQDIPLSLQLAFLGMAASVALLWIPLDRFGFLPDKWDRRFKQMVEGWRVLKLKRSLLARLIGLQMLMTIVSAGRFWIAFHAFSQKISLGECLLFSSATILTRLVNITPNGIGVREGIVAGLASVLGFQPGVSAVAVGLDRLVATAVIIALGTVYTYVLSKKVTDSAPTDAQEP
jgi:uncharacterized membrane protein YbhN (UPF0104 family)